MQTNSRGAKRLHAFGAFLLALLSQPLGHTVYALVHALGPWQWPVAFALGAVGVWLVAQGLERDELQASLFGFLGGYCIWNGWFEFTFYWMATALSVPPLDLGQGLRLPAQTGLLGTTAPLLFALFVIYGLMNRETRCNLMRWLHRRLGVSPGEPTPGLRMNVARVTALETVFVIWTLYAFWVLVLWGLGVGAAFMVVFVAYAGWSLYMIWRLLQSSRPAFSVRYAIPTGIISWSLVEMPAHGGMYREVWLYPLQYPVVCAALLVAFVLAFMVAWRGPAARAADAPVLA